MKWDPVVFYARQDEWSRVYAREIDERDRENAALVAEHCDPAVRRVLELAAGGGQSAVATAELGFEVDAIEQLPHLAARIPAPVRVVLGSFYEVDPSGPYGAVAYWDGFGVDEDEDQIRLLCRIRDWLSPAGRALVEVYDPAYWASQRGVQRDYGDAVRVHDFDGRCWIDTWWRKGDPESAVSQHLSCYTLAEFTDLAVQSGLEVEHVIPSTTLRTDPRRRGRSYVSVLRRS